ncbi:MAG: tetratricopeptide repeat protein [Niveispirillum sp.]|nr:tetratricopeptide repeat protein [Niveispirillum sp.]
MVSVADLVQAAEKATDQGDGAAALTLWRQVLDADPDHVVALTILGDAARRADRVEQAEALLLRAVAVAPRLVPARCALANLLLHTGREADAGAHLAVAQEQGAHQPYVWYDTGLWRRVTGDAAGALAAFERCLSITPEDPSAKLSRALALLRLGRWDEGFRDYHHRWSVSARPPRHRGIAPWRGEDIKGRRLLVWDEQGAGDTIMCARLVRPLIDAGAEVVMEVPAALTPLFADGRHGIIVARDHALPPVDMQVPLLDLPGILGLTPTTIPWDGPYISIDAALSARWADAMPRRQGRMRIGFSWAGNPAHPGDFWRSPGLSALLPLLSRANADWYALQVASGREQMATTPLPGQVTDLGARITGWADTAAILPHLDLLITPDSALAHLAGAMGRPVWTLIATDTDWRWLDQGTKTGWYPSMRLFRQQRCGDWAGLLSRVGLALPA